MGNSSAKVAVRLRHRRHDDDHSDAATGSALHEGIRASIQALWQRHSSSSSLLHLTIVRAYTDTWSKANVKHNLLQRCLLAWQGPVGTGRLHGDSLAALPYP